MAMSEKGHILKKLYSISYLYNLLNQCVLSTNHPEPEFTLAIFCDLSKAFDIISHDILISKLHCYGIRDIAHDWFKHYLADRVQYVEIDEHK